MPLQHLGSIRHWQRLDIVTDSPPPKLVVFGSRCTLGRSSSSSHRHRHTSVALLREYLQWAALGCHVEDDYESGGACLVARCIPLSYMPHAGKAGALYDGGLCLRFMKSDIPIGMLADTRGQYVVSTVCFKTESVNILRGYGCTRTRVVALASLHWASWVQWSSTQSNRSP